MRYCGKFLELGQATDDNMVFLYCVLDTCELCGSMYCFVSIVLFYVLFVCKCLLLPPGVNPIATKYIIYRIPQATNTRSEYVILIDFPRQQWVSEGASMVRCKYIGSLAFLSFFFLLFYIFLYL